MIKKVQLLETISGCCSSSSSRSEAWPTWETFSVYLEYINKLTFSLSVTFTKFWETFAVGLLAFPTFTCTGSFRYSWNNRQNRAGER